MESQSKLESFLQKYSEQTLIRSAIAAIPYVGGALDILMTSKIQNKTLERFQYFVDNLKEQIGGLDKAKIDSAFLESDEFYDLFLQTSNLVTKTRLEEKIRAYSRILTSSLYLDNDNKIKPEDILNIVKELTESDIYLIRVISEYLESENPERINQQIVFDVDALVNFNGTISKDVAFFGLLSLVKSSVIVKNPVKSAPIPRLSYEATPVFQLVKDFLIE